jgi:hypothetical protein
MRLGEREIRFAGRLLGALRLEGMTVWRIEQGTPKDGEIKCTQGVDPILNVAVGMVRRAQQWWGETERQTILSRKANAGQLFESSEGQFWCLGAQAALTGIDLGWVFDPCQYIPAIP